MTEYETNTHRFASLNTRHKLKIGLRRAVLCLLIVAVMPLWVAPQPAQARGFWGWISKVIPFGGVVVEWNHRNRVYRTSERFIQDRNQYYDGLKDVAWQQLKNKEITTIGRTRAAAYLKVLAMIEQERSGQLDVAEGRKREARTQFHNKLKEALVYTAVGSRLAQEVLGSMLNGVDSMEGMVDRALSKLTTGDSNVLQDLRRLKEKSQLAADLSNIFGGRAGAKLRGAFGRIARVIEKVEAETLMGAVDVAGMVKVELGALREELFMMKEIGRKPTAGEAIDYVKAGFLPESDQEGSIPMEAIATILSQLEVGDGSLKDEARRALNAGFAARCAAFSQAFQTQLNKLESSGQEETGDDSGGSSCKAYTGSGQSQKEEDDSGIDELLAFDEDEEEKEVLPQITASGTLSETLKGPLDPKILMGTSFELKADYATGTISGTLKGSRSANPGGWMRCYNPADPSIEYEKINLNTKETYEASFSGSLDKETGEFEIAIKPKGGTTATKVSLFTHEKCLDKNGEEWEGAHGWKGKGTISGGVSKDGGIELKTSWTYSWFFGEVEVTGQWSGNGTVEEPK